MEMTTKINTINVNMENLSEEERETLLKLIEKGNKSESKNKVWKPEFADAYFALSDYGTIYEREWTPGGHNVDISRYAIGNCFKTEEEAEFAVEKLKVTAELKRFAEENNERKLEWGNIELENFNLYYSHSRNVIDAFGWNDYQDDLIYFSSYEIALKARDAIGVDRLKKYYFGIKD